MNHRWTYRLGYKAHYSSKLAYNLSCELGTGYFTRTSAATCTDYLGNLITCAVNEPRFDGGRRISEGVWSNVKPDGSPIVPTPKLLMEGASTNKTIAKTANPVDLTGVTKSGSFESILSIVNDSSELALSGLSNICTGNVYKLDNSGGTTNAYCTIAGDAGNTNKHTVSFYARGTLLAPRLEAVSTGNTVSPSTYTRVQHSDNAKIESSAVVQVLPGGVAYFILPQLEESPVCTSVIPNDTGSALARTADALSWPLSSQLQALLSIDKAWSTSYADETGLTWGPEKNQSSFADGQAWFDHPDKDLSSYANSGKMMILRDSAGRLAWGFIGAAGTGQTLGSELLVNGGFDTDTTSWIKSNVSAFTSEPGGINGNYGKIVASASYPNINQTIVSNKLKGSLYSLTINSKSISGNNLTIKPYITTQSGSSYSLSDTWTEFKKYQNHTYTTKPIFYALIGNAALNTIVGVDSVSLKEILAPSAKGVYIYKDAARTLQGWNMEANFNMNDTSYTFDVVDDCKAEGTVVLDWVPGYIPPASQIGIVSCSAAVDSMLSVASGASVLRAYDATTAISGGATLVAGTQRKLVLRWSSATRKYQISSIASGVLTNGTEGNFDGAFALGTNLLLHYSNAYPAKYGGLKIFNRKLTDSELARL